MIVAKDNAATRTTFAVNRAVQSPSFLLMYPPLQFGAYDVAKPDGSLSLPYLAASLRREGYEVDILDTSVGPRHEDLRHSFFRTEALESGLCRVGMASDEILRAVERWDVIGITSIFAPQTTMALEVIRAIKRAFPEKLVIAGGGNARALHPRFLHAGADLVCLSEAENTIVEVARILASGSRDFRELRGVAIRDGANVRVSRAPDIAQDLDTLAMPAWDLLPNEKYWRIARPHGGEFPSGKEIRYASMMTSRGCPFRCTFCHISKETEDSLSGPLANLRFKSFDRVLAEIENLASLGVEYVFIEDDSLFAKKKRIVEILRALKRYRLRLADVNGVNIVHLFKRSSSGRLVVDEGFIETLVDVGFENLSLPFESANQRILDKYASSKWQIDKLDSVELVKACRRVGLHDIHGNYMLGYPDETLVEIRETVDLARKHIDVGLNYALFFAVVPYPGSKLFDLAVERGHINADFDTDHLRWTNASMKNTVVPAEQVDQIRQEAWLRVNRPEYVRYKTAMTVGPNEERSTASQQLT